MAMQSCGANSQIHTAGDKVESLEIILKGSVRMTYPGNKEPIVLKTGSIIGISENPGKKYIYNYEANEECTIYSYPFENMEDIDKVVSVNKKIAPVVASASVNNAYLIFKFLLIVEKEANQAYTDLQDDVRNYPSLCNAVGKKPEDFSDIEEMAPPSDRYHLADWQIRFLQSVYTYDDKMQKTVYSLGVEMCVGTIYNISDLIHEITEKVVGYKSYIKNLKEDSKEFRSAFTALNMEKTGLDKAGEAVLLDGAVPDMEDAAQTILSYAQVDSTTAEKMTQLMDNYVRLPDRGSTDENVRKLRRGIADQFYKIYRKAILRYFKEDGANVPIEVELFLKFGFFDERVVDRDDIAMLYKLHVTYVKDPRGKVVTIPEWLRLIYDMELMPSKNEFDLDYPAALREMKQNGDISEEKEAEMLDDEIERVSFEIKNLFTLGNRMTFGRISVFIPIFDSVNQMMPLDKCYASQMRVNEELNKIREVDFQCFYREYQYSNDEDDTLPKLTFHTECMPYVILMPNIGSRSVLWQEIEGKKRSTSARMLMPIFSLEDFSLAVTRMCGEFRWEMCKTEQGVHWNDISDPSLTAEYSDFLQYYRKNSALNAEQKEKVKKALQKAGNNYRTVFVADYVLYIMYEANGSLRLSKVSRDILYRYCPFTFEVSEKLMSNSQYMELINRRKNKGAQAAKPLENLVKKREHEELFVPDEFYKEVEYLKR